MTCEFDYCIYNKKKSCILDEIEISATGTCDSCELVTIPKEILTKSKSRRLRTINNYGGNNA